MAEDDVAEALLTLKPALPTKKEWFKIFKETDAFIEDEKTAGTD